MAMKKRHADLEVFELERAERLRFDILFCDHVAKFSVAVAFDSKNGS